MPETELLYEEDITEIGDAIALLTMHPNIDRLDVKLHEPTMSALVYWTGTVLRVDIKGLR